MQYDDDFEKSITIGRKAMELMEEKKSAAIPPNYEVWYNYVLGRHHDLVRHVDTLTANSDTMPQWQATAIYNAHLHGNENIQKVEKLNTHVSDEIDRVMEFVQQAIGEAGKYGASLDSVSERLGGEHDTESVRMIVETLVESTKQMQESNSQLETKLQESGQQIVDLNKSLEVVRTESRTDQLTTIANRKHFDEAIEQMAAEARETGEEFCLVIGDIDHFKSFNDTYGHTTGDQVLRFVAHTLKNNVKGRDLAVRFGGEEFAILLPQTKLQAAVIVANQIRTAIQAKELVKKSTGENLGRVTMSFGVARYRPEDTINEFIHRSDICLYQAKHAGRNKVCCETDPDVRTDANVA